MAYSDEELDKYLKKAQEVLNSKKEDYLSEDDLQDIAQRLGLDIKEIVKAKEDYLTRGNNHLNFGNYDEAIKEYEQLLLLAPKDAQGMYGLAQAHLEKWHHDGKKVNKEKALEYANSCIEIDPKFQKAYAIISELKQKPQGKKKRPAKPPTPKKKVKQAKKKAPKPVQSSSKKNKVNWGTAAIPILFMGVVIAFQFGIFSYKSKGTSQYKVAPTKNGIVIWQVKYTKYKKYPYYRKVKLLIADAATGKLLKEVDLPERKKTDGNYFWNRVKRFNGSFYDYYNDYFIARDIRTGEVTDSKELISQKFPKIEGGIGKIRTYNRDWFKVTSKQGTEYWYNLRTKKLLSQREYNQRNQNKTPFWQYTWQKVINPDNQNQFKFLLSKQLSKRRYVRTQDNVKRSYNKSLQNNINRGYVRLITRTEKSNYFLRPKTIYADSTHLLFKYQTEIGKEGVYRLACLNGKGDVVWEKGLEDLEVPLLKYLLGNNYSRTNTYFARHKNVLGISSQRVRKNKKSYRNYKIAVGVDLNTGKVVWKYSPGLYKTKFKKDK